jgi:putative ATP-binding cassette transporter
MKLTSVLMRYSRGNLIVASMAGVIAGICSTGLVVLINYLLGSGSVHPGLFVLFIGLSLLVPLTGTLSTYLLVRLGQQAIVDMRLDLSRSILRTPLSQLEALGAHRLLAALTEDVSAVTQAVALVPAVCMSGALVAGSLAYLGWLSWRLLLVILILLVLGAATYQVPLIAGGRHMRRFRQAGDVLFGSFRGLTDGTKELKLNGRRRAAFLSRLEAQAVQLRDLGVSAITLLSLATNWGQLLIFVTLGGLLFFEGGSPDPAQRQVLNGFVLVLLFMMGPLQSLLAFLPQIGRANVALQKIDELGLKLQSSPEEAPAALLPSAPWRQVELSGITHAYRKEGEDQSFMLGPLDLKLSPGEILFITGGNGSGKTTLAKILVGLYVPQSGEIRVDGEMIDDSLREGYRQRFSALFSDFFLFDELLGVEGEGLEERTKALLERLQLAHKVRIEGTRLSTTSLSQGQRKRLALLSAYLEDRPIYLFDEWAADQDPHFKEIFYRQLLPELKSRSKAVCVISHDDHYYSVADRIIKIEDGKIESEFRVA